MEVPELTAANPRRIEAWLAGMEADVERLCRCPDLACAQRVLTDGQGLGLPKGQLTPDEAARVNAAMQRLATCYADLQRAPSSP